MGTVTVENLKKSFGKVQAIAGISFETVAGEIFGIIGADGAGKSTLLQILVTLLTPSGGSGTILGYDIFKDYRKIRTLVGYMPERFSLYPDLTVEENLQFFTKLFNVRQSSEELSLNTFARQLIPFKNRRAGKLSGGMKQKLALSCALVHNPQLLILDEPTRGVDPISRTEFWQKLISLRDSGKTIIVTTSYMDEANLCDRIAFCDQGRFLLTDSPQSIINKEKEPIYAIRGSNMFRLLQTVRQWERTKACYTFGDTLHLRIDKGYSTDELLRFLKNSGCPDVSIQTIKANIEDCFMQLVNNPEKAETTIN